ncbi:MAG: tetratricopeptide repeat protein [Cyanobacteria bacterium P01_E01_bin.35]
MSHSPPKVPLGAVLQQAGLVSADQVRQALEQQHQTHNNLKIGEILAIRGWINSQTADFFAERWFRLIDEQPKQPIGQYLKQAALLNDQQIKILLEEQKQTKVKFGELAIAKGWLKRTTVNFFLRYLMSDSLAQSKVSEIKSRNSAQRKLIDSTVDIPRDSQSHLSAKKSASTQSIFSLSEQKNINSGALRSTEDHEYSQKIHEGFLKIKQKLLKIEGQKNYSEKTLDRVLLWTGGQSFLTQKLFTLIAENINHLNHQAEEQQIDHIVQAKIITNWDRELKSHFNGIKQRLLDNQNYQPHELLLLYQRILTNRVLANESAAQQELLNIGLVVRQQNDLVVANSIYQSVFNLGWIAKILNVQTQQQNSVATLSRSTPQNNKSSWFQLKNILLLLTIIGLLTIFVNNIAKRLAVRLAFRQGNELLQQKSFTQAMAQYNQLLHVDSNYFQAWTNRGYALAGLQKYEEMQESCSTATIIEPTAVYAWNCRGEALHNLQRYNQAVAAFDRAIALNQSDPIFLINKSESLRALGKNKESITVVQEAIEVLEQIEATRSSANINGEFAVALTVLGNGLRQQAQYADAIQAYQRAITYSASYFPAHIGQGIALIGLQRYQDAQNELESILENFSLTEAQQSQTWFHLGKALCNAADYTRGIAAFERAIELNPDYQAALAAKKQCN